MKSQTSIKKNFIYDFMNVIPFMLKKEKFEELVQHDPELRKFYILQENGFYKVNVLEKDKEMLKELSHCKEQASSFIADAALAIVVMADPLASDVWIEDAAIASIMIQLQAEDLGLGSCWVQVRERFTATGMPSDEFVHGILDIPLQLQVLSVIAVGHKGMERKPFNEEHLQWEKIHINKFGGK